MAKQTQSATTFSLEALRAIVNTAEARELFKEIMSQEKTAYAADQMETATIRAFKKLGYTDIQPRVNILTYARWLEQGRRVKAGETSVRVKNLRLFHVSQTELLSKAEAKAAIADLEAKRAAKTADKLPKPSPVAAAPVKAKGRKPAPAQPSA